MTDAAFTPAREEARVAALVAAVRSRGLDGPLWLLCPHEGRRAALLDHLARAGGGWIHPLDWHGLLDLLEHRLGLVSRPLLAPGDRLLVVESSLERAAATDRPLAAALRGDALAVARAVAGVVDTLRLHGWDGALPSAPAESRVALGHLAVLAAVTRALDAHLATTGETDLADRLARLCTTAPRPALRGVLLWVEGADRLSPRERRALDLAAGCGAAVSLPAWIDRVDDAPDGATTAPTLLAALRQGAAKAASDDGSLDVHAVPDVLEEAETVAGLVEAHLAAGGRPEDVAVVCGPEPGAWPRVARALDRWGIPWSGGGSLLVQHSPLWQIVRASLRLAWNGPDAVDLATVLTAPGSGIYGTDRDYFVSRLWRKTPTTWADVRAALDEATAVGVGDPGAAASPDDDAQRARGEQIRKRVGPLLTAWEAAGPLQRRTPDERAALLPAVLEGAVLPLLDPVSIDRAVHDPRASAAWLASADAIRAALDLSRRRLGSVAHRGRRLCDVERLLTDLEATFPVLRDAAPATRRDAVALVGDDAWSCDPPAVLIVTGFLRGRHPRLPPPTLLLGPAERALLAGLSSGLGALPDEPMLHALSRRATLRMLAAPRERLVLLSPRRTAEGARGEVALALRDLLDRLPAVGVAAAAVPPLRPTAARARVRAAIRALGRGDVAAALEAGAALAAADLAVRDLFAARLRPDDTFAVGTLAGPLVRGHVHVAGDLEALLTCHYRYLMTALLGLGPAPLRRRPRISESLRQVVARGLLGRIDEALGAAASMSREERSEAVEAVVQQHAPWSVRADQRDARRRLVAECTDLADRYLELRQALPGAARAPVGDDAPRGMFPLDDGARVQVALPAATALRAPDGRGGDVVVVVQLARARPSPLAQRRDVGLDVEGALLAQVPPAGAAALLRLDLATPVIDVMTAEDAPSAEALVATAARAAVRSEWLHGAQLTLDDHAVATGARLAEALADIEAPGGWFPPLDPDRAETLDKAKALPCGRCGARLGCRVGLAGGAA